MQFFSKIKKIVFFIVLTSFILLQSCVKIENTENNKNATFNIGKNIDSTAVYKLDGQWEFVWDTLLNPSEYKNYKDTIYSVTVPDYWTNYTIEGKKLPNFGYATYHSKIIVPHPGIYAFKFKRIFLSAKIYINDSVLLSIGKVATNPKEYKPSRLTKEVSYYLASDTNDILIQVANFSHKKAGITRGIKFGSIKAIKLFTYTTLLYDTFVVGSLLFMMIFFFILYFYNKKIKSNLFFSLFLFVEIITIIFDRELIFYRIFKGLSWNIASKLFYIAAFIRAFFFLILLDSFKPGIINKYVKSFSMYFAALMSLFVIFTPMKIYTRTLIIMVAFTFLTFIYELVVLSKNVKENKLLHFVLWALLFMILTSVNDALYDYRIINTFYMSGIGIFVFTLLQAIEISVRNAKLMNTEDFLKNKFQIQNRLKLSLLNTPAYDLKAVLQEINKNLNIDKIILFSIEEGKLNLSIISTREKTLGQINKEIDFNYTYDEFDINLVKLAYDSKIPVTQSDLKQKNKKDNSLVLPLLNKNQLIALIYFENNKKMPNGLIEVLSSAQTVFKSIINTAVTYFNLERLNFQLDQTVKERTEKVLDQKIELQKKNDELDEKIQLLEEQYKIQKEVNENMQATVEEIKQNNEIINIQNKFINQQNEKIEKHTKLINDDINFANQILSIIQSKKGTNYFSEYFHIDLPKNIISGDFLFAYQQDNFVYIALGDATGHGVPGALMRAFAYKELQDIVTNARNLHKNTGKILDLLRDKIKRSLSSENIELSEGLDISFAAFDFNENKLYYSGAYSPLFLIRNGKLLEFKADRMPIGKYIEKFEKHFRRQVIPFFKDDIFYMNSDGFQDQFGGKNHEKYYSANFKKLLTNISNKPLNIQKDILIKEFHNFKGNYTQIDDVSIVGLKI